MYEVIVLERCSDSSLQSVIRVGFATAGASLFLSDKDSVCFDSEGTFIHCNIKRQVCQRFFTRCQVIAVVLNLDPGSCNLNTVSLFCDGVRIAEPQKLPSKLLGKALFPAVHYRGVTLRVNFGVSPVERLPFTCRMVQEAAVADC